MDWFLTKHEPVVDVPVFAGFPKIPRFSRDIIITEKIDGTNAQIYITEDRHIYAGSRTRWVTPGKQTDNHGFAAWVETNHEALMDMLGPGRHYGEWWGQGINRGYGLKEKRFSLFNVTRWFELNVDYGLGMVPVLHRGIMSIDAIEYILTALKVKGSSAAPGYMKPEGIVIYHTAGNLLFKKTIEKDEVPKKKDSTLGMTIDENTPWFKQIMENVTKTVEDSEKFEWHVNCGGEIVRDAIRATCVKCGVTSIINEEIE